MSILCTVELLSVRIYLVRPTVYNTILCRNVTNLVVVICEVSAYIVVEVLTYVVVPCQTDFYTFILDITTIHILGFCTNMSRHWCLNEPVLGSLDVIVECKRQTTIEETCVNTKVELL